MHRTRSFDAGEHARPWMVGLLIWLSCCVSLTWAEVGKVGGGLKGRSLLGFKEMKGNTSFHCSPSGPCLPCQYSEKNDEKYHCSETGYHVPLKCVEMQEALKDGKSRKFQRLLASLEGHKETARVPNKFLRVLPHMKWRKLLDLSSTSEGGKLDYITYRSCVPIELEEKLSVLGFEVIIVSLLLISGSIIYFRRKRTALMPGVGAVRLPANSLRF